MKNKIFRFLTNSSRSPAGSRSILPVLSLHRQATFRNYSATYAKRLASDSTGTRKTVSITFIEADDTEKVVEAEIGKSLMEVARQNHIQGDDIGLCGGQMECSSCHMILEENIYKTLPPVEEEEFDALDYALELTETSRLGCQIIVRPDFQGMTVRIPGEFLMS